MALGYGFATLKRYFLRDAKAMYIYSEDEYLGVWELPVCKAITLCTSISRRNYVHILVFSLGIRYRALLVGG